jgi:hypothetical protein
MVGLYSDQVQHILKTGFRKEMEKKGYLVPGEEELQLTERHKKNKNKKPGCFINLLIYYFYLFY